MNVHFSYKIAKTADIENLLQHQTDKLNRLLQVFRPNLVHLKGSVAENPGPGFLVSLNLRLPTGQLVTQGNAGTISATVRAAFGDLAEQLKKHKQLLRNQHKWPRRRGPSRAAVNTVPFEQTVAVVKPQPISSGDISGYVDANLPRLRRFIERELMHRESEGRLLHDAMTVDDVVSEAIASALDEHYDKPERMRLEPWLYRLATKAIESISASNADDGRVATERKRAGNTVEQPADLDEPQGPVDLEGAIADSNAQTPEDLAARNELIGLVERSLLKAGRNQREAFILYTIEGFTIDEIADITSHSAEQVRADIRSARDYLQTALPLRDPLKDKLVEYARTA
jgi:RNA polymerase sigma factor (sigma-70 family)